MTLSVLLSLAASTGTLVGGAVMYYAGRMRLAAMQRRANDQRRERGMVAYQNGLAMGLTIGRGESSTRVLDGKLEHWDADAETCWRNLIAPSVFAEESTS